MKYERKRVWEIEIKSIGNNTVTGNIPNWVFVGKKFRHGDWPKMKGTLEKCIGFVGGFHSDWCKYANFRIHNIATDAVIPFELFS